MPPVQGIFLLGLCLASLAACSTGPEELPLLFPEPEPPAPPPVREPPRGFLGDPTTLVFHRTDCPDAKAIDPARQEFWAFPWEALNAGYAPCKWCEPMRGWK